MKNIVAASTTTFDLLLAMADNPAFADKVPFTFIAYFSFTGASQEFLAAGWRLFKRTRAQRIAAEDVLREMEAGR